MQLKSIIQKSIFTSIFYLGICAFNPAFAQNSAFLDGEIHRAKEQARVMKEKARQSKQEIQSIFAQRNTLTEQYKSQDRTLRPELQKIREDTRRLREQYRNQTRP